jgi:lysyl-tRNA synthetase class 2
LEKEKGRDAQEELSDLMRQRRQKLEELISAGVDPFRSRFDRTHIAREITDSYGNLQPGETTDAKVRVAGRVVAIREHGKAAFTVIRDDSGDLQLYLRVDTLGEEKYQGFLRQIDIGDWLGASGTVFRTRRGELSVWVEDGELLTKSLRPLPEKWHGLKDVEIRYRQRYLDLIVNPGVKEIFVKRNRTIRLLRKFLDDRGFLEVDMPMLHPIPGGATARPFVTYHNALGMNLYLRIAPELYLKRLVVGGFEKVYELNRSFRNEGISVRHNPEFTMLEVYQAYADYHQVMDFTEEMIRYVVKEVTGSLKVSYQDQELNFESPWARYTMLEALEKIGDVKVSYEDDIVRLRQVAEELELQVHPAFGKGKLINEIFEKVVEPKLIQPTFVLDYPLEITPLARRNPKNSNLVERFELVIAGREIANAFSELTDPLEQRKRFEEQAALREAGLEEAQMLDEDFVRALEYGMPPTGGLGIGVDRLVMLVTDSYSIREVIFFPQLRPEK